MPIKMKQFHRKSHLGRTCVTCVTILETILSVSKRNTESEVQTTMTICFFFFFFEGKREIFFSRAILEKRIARDVKISNGL